ncbi:MAG: cupin domain-containing protein [Gammaproteobacteria bacterium]|jgi:predicted cupin superfamily sugar epimerase|nr:cupin domain-containing protein [Gammaproteobacteria bacterium]MDH5226462.1 cupin domain-containing protein [Gammaproteobacteria bacterium]
MTSLPAAADLVRDLRLLPHPEGGFYRETYRATQVHGGRAASTMIYFLLPAGQVSRLHRIDADEGWHHYLGGTLEIFELDEAEPDRPRVTRLGKNLAAGELPQHMVPAGRWFGAAPAAGAPYALVGCTVAPGFEFAKFELGTRERLLAKFPAAADIVVSLT